MSKVERRDVPTLLQMIEHFSQKQGSSSWLVLPVFVLVAVAVACTLVLVYKKRFAAEAE